MRTLTRSAAAVRAETLALVLAAVLKRKQDLDKARSAGQEQAAQLKKLLQGIQPLIDDAQGRAALSTLAEVFPQWRQSFNDIASLAAAGQADAADRVRVERQRPLANQLVKGAEDLTALLKASAQAALDGSAQRARTNRWLIVACVSLSLCAGLLFLFTIRSIVDNLRHATSQLTLGASQSLAQGSSELAAALQRTSASTSEISAMASRNTGHSQQAAGLTASATLSFDSTDQSLHEMVAAIGGIAFQTNILDLNAAVEAARAGEAGLGFAVVADGVRSLSQRCAQAASETAALIEESISKSSEGKAKVDLVAGAFRLQNMAGSTAAADY